jgi:hypothetical protein
MIPRNSTIKQIEVFSRGGKKYAKINYVSNEKSFQTTIRAYSNAKTPELYRSDLPSSLFFSSL